MTKGLSVPGHVVKALRSSFEVVPGFDNPNFTWRWDALHSTLLFLGPLSSERLEQVKETLQVKIAQKQKKIWSGANESHCGGSIRT